MQRLILLIWLGFISITNILAQSGIEVQYFMPVEHANGTFTASAVPYTLWCKAEHSIFFQKATKGNLDLDEQGQRFVMNFASGENLVYKDLRQSRLINVVTSLREKQYRIEEHIPRISWQILQEKKAIEGITVRKARGQFRGRNYTAWFAPDIPLAHGPWKLGGLPGLILEAYDDDKLVVFLFHALHLNNSFTIEKPKRNIPAVDLRTYQTICREEIIQYFEFLNARLRKEGSSVSYETGDFDLWERLN